VYFDLNPRKEKEIREQLRAILLPTMAALMIALPPAGCDGDNGTSDDAISDTTDVPAEETTLPPECNDDYDPLNPEMRMIYFDLQAPNNLDNEVLERLMLEGFDNGDFIWLIQFTGVDDGSTDTDGVMHLFTGSGETVGEFGVSNCFRFTDTTTWLPADADMDTSGNDMSWPAGEAKINITVPVFKTDEDTGVKDLLLELPLKELEVASGTFSADRTTIGAAASCLTDGAVLRGLITVEDAKGVVIEEMGLTLCGLLSGDKGTDLDKPDDDCQRPIAEWSEPPDAELTGEPAYTMQACFSAAAVTIID